MSSLKWFDGDSKDALQQMVQRNCVFLAYIGKGNDEFTEILNDSNISQLMNHELILCYKMDPASSSFKNFKDIFNDVVIPSIYLLEKNNTHQYVIKKKDLMDANEVQLDLKHQLFNGIHWIMNDIAEMITVDADKQKYLQFITDTIKKEPVIFNPILNCNVHEVADIKPIKSNDNAKIKIKVPYNDITMIQEFQTTSSLHDVKTFVLNNIILPKGSIKFIAHRQFTDKDLHSSLETLNLCPSSTIYVHVLPSSSWLHSVVNSQLWPKNLINLIIIKPINIIQNYFMSFIRRQPISAPRTFDRQNETFTNKKFTRKPVSNIHRLRTNNSDDDETNTYNGNSTQQL